MKNHDRNAVSLEIRARCWKIFFFAICISQILKAALWQVFGGGYDIAPDTVLAFVPDAFCIVLVYYICLFWHAKKGMLWGVKAEAKDVAKFPACQYTKIALISSLILSVAPFALRALVSCAQPGWEGMAAVWVFLAFAGLTFAGAFALLYLNFFIAYRVAKRCAVEALENE